jgi:hypothetical protein
LVENCNPSGIFRVAEIQSGIENLEYQFKSIQKEEKLDVDLLFFKNKGKQLELLSESEQKILWNL